MKQRKTISCEKCGAPVSKNALRCRACANTFRRRDGAIPEPDNDMDEKINDGLIRGRAKLIREAVMNPELVCGDTPEEHRKCHELIAKRTDGPADAPADCERCGFRFFDDIYRYQGKTLCGDCRYIVRHGKVPPRTAPPGRATTDDLSPWQENAIRCMEDSLCR